MDTITTTARQRAVMATVADLIVATAAGRTLRVAVGCTRPDETTFADQLALALHARGRPGHCLRTNPRPVRTDRPAGIRSDGDGDGDGPTVAVITSGAPDADETEVCRINIQLYAPDPATPPVAGADRGTDGQRRGSVGGQKPDIIIDYLDPGGAVIRHLGPGLAARSSTSSQSGRRVRPS